MKKMHTYKQMKTPRIKKIEAKCTV